jgi:1-(5-phosphoribosyl)-5-[(5-phosphoribosylamino)methylideneamino] imidazole-4-carboxamide isomerase/N-(5'phosphoribosyl)anthranilate isomerase
MKKFELLPAVDIKAGRAVRLKQGEINNKTIYGSPRECALDFQKAGATWLHLVDLDAAFGVGGNADLVLEVINSLSIKVELSGGIRTDESLSRALATNCERVILGTAALEDPKWASAVIQMYGQKVAVSLDVKGETLAARGWVKEGGNLYEAITRLADDGCALFIVTDISKDGTLTGPNFELLERVCSFSKVPVIASGGISSLKDLEKLVAMQDIGIQGAIVGKALYESAFTLADALKVVNV